MSNQQQYDYYLAQLDAHGKQYLDSCKEAYAHLGSCGADSDCRHEAKGAFRAMVEAQHAFCLLMHTAAATVPNVTVASAPGKKRNEDITVTP